MIAKESTVWANPMLVGNADDIHDNFMDWAQLLSTDISQQLIVFFVWIGDIDDWYFIEQ